MKSILFICCLIFMSCPVFAVSVDSVDELINVLGNESYIFVENGVYYIDHIDIPENTVLEGSGISTIFIKINGTDNYGFGVDGNNVKLCNFWYDGNGFNCPASTHGIRINAKNNVEICNVKITNTVHHGITGVYPCTNVNIHDNVVSGTGCLDSQDGAGIIVNGKNCIVNNNFVSNTAYHGLQAYTNSQQIIFSNNLLQYCGDNLRAGSSKGAGIKASTGNTDIIIMGNSIYEQKGEGILIDDADNVSCTNNIIVNASRSIYVKNSNTSVIGGNIIRKSRTDGIYLYNSNDCIVYGNIVKEGNIKTYQANRNLISLNSMKTLINNGNNTVINNYKGLIFTP